MYIPGGVFEISTEKASISQEKGHVSLEKASDFPGKGVCF